MLLIQSIPVFRLRLNLFIDLFKQFLGILDGLPKFPDLLFLPADFLRSTILIGVKLLKFFLEFRDLLVNTG